MSNEYSRLAFVSGHAALMWYSAVFTSVSSIHQPLVSATIKPLCDHSFSVVNFFRGLPPRTICVRLLSRVSVSKLILSHIKKREFLIFSSFLLVKGRGYGYGLIPELLKISISFLNEMFCIFCYRISQCLLQKKTQLPFRKFMILKSLSV